MVNESPHWNHSHALIAGQNHNYDGKNFKLFLKEDCLFPTWLFGSVVRHLPMQSVSLSQRLLQAEPSMIPLLYLSHFRNNKAYMSVPLILLFIIIIIQSKTGVHISHVLVARQSSDFFLRLTYVSFKAQTLIQLLTLDLIVPQPVIQAFLIAAMWMIFLTDI